MSANDHPQPRFHRGITLFLALLLSLSVCFTGTALSLRRSLALEHPAQTAREHFERTIELEAALEHEPAWLRRTVLLFLGRVRPALSEAIDAYDEVVELQARALRADEEAPGRRSADAGPEAPTAPEGAGGVEGTVPRDPARPASSTEPAHDAAGAASTAQAPDSTPGPASEPAPAAPDAAAKDDATPTSSPGFACVPGEPEVQPKDSRADLCELLARRAILQGESESFDDVLLSVARLEGLGEAALARAIRHAYQRLEPRTRPAFSEFDLSGLRPGWARDQLELRLARRTGETARVNALESDARAGAERIQRRAERLAALLLAPAVLGLLALLAWLVRDRPALPRSSATIPPAWSFEDGLAVLLRALVFGFAVLALVSLAVGELAPAWVPLCASLLAPVPLILLFHRGLLAPRALAFVRVLGLDALPGQAWRWIAIVLGLFAADQLGQALILELCGRVGLGLHWTEPVPEPLLHAPLVAFAAILAVGIAWDPLMTELTRRGLLFLTLRARMPAFSAALWSAALVAAFHNASLPSFLMIVWSGFLCAWTFEQTRSILPAVLAQVLAYAGFYGAFASFYR